ncbi:hypothetical protein [Burkholderia multivorans]|uniref:hypothetical protein n=1 Tax=Burkholderia multivorans TaxID=87883 RepID=UPI001C21EAD6|nr:hypothetical protein [Burkholderia multivorans]MBU9163581.1 hypothetical protein [Burkholderia multivorans]
MSKMDVGGVRGLRAEVDRLRADIEALEHEITTAPRAGLHAALAARRETYGRRLRRLAEIMLAAPMPRRELTPLLRRQLDTMGATERDREWMSGRAPCPTFDGRDVELTVIRAEWYGGATEELANGRAGGGYGRV